MKESEARSVLAVRAPVAPVRLGPPLTMCLTACLTVLALAGHRSGGDGMAADALAINPNLPEPEEIALVLADETRFDGIDTQSVTVELAADRDALEPVELRSRLVRRLLAEGDGRDLLSAARSRYDAEVRRDLHAGRTRILFAAGALEHGGATSREPLRVPTAVASQLAEVLAATASQNGRQAEKLGYRIVYAETTQGAAHSSHQLLAAQVRGMRTHSDVYYFENRAGVSGYFDGAGRALERDFLRYPVEFTRITSGFSERRFHPVLHRMRAHYGVDFAAPSGTPVRAVAKGVVTRAGWVGGNGRFVKLRHDDRYESDYAHLSRITTGLAIGTRVEKGEVIGTVGASGLATGAHLHFALYRDGRYIDPLTADPGTRYALRGRALHSFRRSVAELNDVLDDGIVPRRDAIVTALLTN